MNLNKDPNTTAIKRKAEGHFAKGHLKKALDYYIKLADMLPKDMRIVQKIADINYKLGNIEEAKSNYKKAAEHFASEGYWAKAVALNKVLIDLDPDNTEIQQKIADIYTTQGLAGEKLVFKTQEKDGQAEKSEDDESKEEGQKAPKALRIPLFSDLKAEALNELIGKMAVRRVPSGDLICRQGQPGNSMFVISEGWVEIFIEDDKGKKQTLDRLKDGDFFGEFGLLTNGKRHAGALAKSDAVLLEITSGHFEELAKKHPHVPEVLEEYFKTRMFDNVLRKSHLFESLFSKDRIEIVKKFKSQKVDKGNFVFKEGDDGDRIYFIKNGEAEIVMDKDGDTLVVARIEVGDFFGEIAILKDGKRTASVRAASPLEILYLERSDFKRILEAYPQLEAKLKKTMEERAKDTIEAYQSHQEMKKCLGMV